MNFLQSQIIFYITLVFVLFIPGWCLLLAVFGKNKIISELERFAIAFGLSIISVDFIFFLFDKLKIPITRPSSLFGILVFSLVCLGIYKFRKFKNTEEKSELFHFSKNQFILILLLLFLTVFIKTAFLSGTILPTATDMGHHMYWAKWMVENSQLPTYDGMPDFIIGEHVIFGIIGIISGASFFSAFPLVILFLINIFSILAIFILVLRIFKNLPQHQRNIKIGEGNKNSELENPGLWCGGKNVAILSILFTGVLFAVSSPQAKFVSGGVVGNIMGNLLMPLAFYFYYRAFSFLEDEDNSNSKIFLSLAVFMTFGLFYTHHLTAFIFLFVFALLTVIFLAINYKDLEKILPKVLKIIFSWQVLGTFVLGLIFFFGIFTPTYISGSAVGTAVGAPSKETRAGLSLMNINSAVGEARLALGFIGLIILILNYRKRNFGYALISAWAVMIFIMSAFPKLLLVNLPSSRIGNYLSYPLAILSAYAFFEVYKNYKTNNLIRISFFIVLAFAFSSGLYDSAQSFKIKLSNNELTQTFNASNYLAQKTNNADFILKDHNYLTADTWMKLFFMRGYKYPDSRSYFKRYEDLTKPREMCTLQMISNPSGEEALQCFSETKTNFIVVNPKFDSMQFLKLENFDEVYSSSDVAVFYRK